MTDTRSTIRPPAWFWVIAIVLLVWELIGCMGYLASVTMTPEQLIARDPIEAQITASMPSWVTASYAVAVWTGLAGAIGLLLRRRFALPGFVVSLMGVVLLFGWEFLASPLLSLKGPGAALFPLFILVMGVVGVWVARTADARRWLR